MRDWDESAGLRIRGAYGQIMMRRLRDDLPPVRVVLWATLRCWVVASGIFLLAYDALRLSGDAGVDLLGDALISGLFGGVSWLFVEVMIDTARVSRLDMPDGAAVRDRDGYGSDCETIVIRSADGDGAAESNYWGRGSSRWMVPAHGVRHGDSEPSAVGDRGGLRRS